MEVEEGPRIGVVGQTVLIPCRKYRIANISVVLCCIDLTQVWGIYRVQYEGERLGVEGKSYTI